MVYNRTLYSQYLTEMHDKKRKQEVALMRIKGLHVGVSSTWGTPNVFYPWSKAALHSVHRLRFQHTCDDAGATSIPNIPEHEA